tara:strand:- start:622 stop:756 length:135 start_codon:yes stop_codon:yes gene_type:complete
MVVKISKADSICSPATKESLQDETSSGKEASPSFFSGEMAKEVT